MRSDVLVPHEKQLADLQQGLIDQLAAVATRQEMEEILPDIFADIRAEWLRLHRRQVPIEELTVKQKLRIPLEAYKVRSPAAPAGAFSH